MQLDGYILNYNKCLLTINDEIPIKFASGPNTKLPSPRFLQTSPGNKSRGLSYMDPHIRTISMFTAGRSELRCDYVFWLQNIQ